MFVSKVFLPPVFAIVAYLVLLGAFSAGEGDAAGLAAGLALVAGELVALLGEVDVDAGADGDGDDVVLLGEFELFSGSVVHAAANAIAVVASSTSAIRLIRFVFGLVIGKFPRPAKIEKQDDNYATAAW